jgi:RNA polymerase sigma-70 factor (ECF subfamily)
VEECLRIVRSEVQPRTYEAFRRFAIEEQPASAVAEELGLSANAVFLAKSRILKRVRELMPLVEDVW